MKISEGGRGRGGVLLKEWTTHSLSISVCWFWFWLLQTRKRSPEEMGLLV